jgi:hypothetical protein
MLFLQIMIFFKELYESSKEFQWSVLLSRCADLKGLSMCDCRGKGFASLKLPMTQTACSDNSQMKELCSPWCFLDALLQEKIFLCLIATFYYGNMLACWIKQKKCEYFLSSFGLIFIGHWHYLLKSKICMTQHFSSWCTSNRNAWEENL